MSVSKEELENICKKWNIDYEQYTPWIAAEDFINTFDQIKRVKNIKTDKELCDSIGMPPPSLSFLRAKENMHAPVAIMYLDRLGIDPKPYLKRKSKRSPKKAGELDIISRLFLDTFPDSEDKAKLIKHREKILQYVNELEEKYL